MFGLVKASRLRKAESDLRAACKRRDANAKVRDEFVTIARDTAAVRDNWQAIAESRLVAVLLLRDRLIAADASTQEVAQALVETAMAAADKAKERDAADLQVSEHERTIARMNERFNELTAKWEASTAESALNAAQRDDARAASDDRRKERDEARASAMTELNATLSAISDEAFRLRPEIETAIIRPSSTNRLRWRVNDDDGKALCQSSTGYATPEECTSAFARAAFLISLDYRAPEDDRIGRIREVLTREPDTV